MWRVEDEEYYFERGTIPWYDNLASMQSRYHSAVHIAPKSKLLYKAFGVASNQLYITNQLFFKWLMGNWLEEPKEKP